MRRRLLWAAIPLAVCLVLVGSAVVIACAVPATPAAGPSPTPVAAPPTGTACRVLAAEAPGARDSELPVQPLCALPVETTTVVRAVQRRGPFAGPKDGSTFRNAERLLPIRPSGYYREYTVLTPGEPDRGARRLIAGRGGEFYYTADHYVSFVVVDVTADREATAA